LSLSSLSGVKRSLSHWTTHGGQLIKRKDTSRSVQTSPLRVRPLDELGAAGVNLAFGVTQAVIISSTTDLGQSA